jgi:hypothetical protein
MGSPAVNLDDEARLAPEDVDSERTDPDVGLRRGYPVAATELEECRLGLARGSVGVYLAEREAEVLRDRECRGLPASVVREPIVTDRINAAVD